MTHPAVAVLESALRSRKLDRTLTTALPSLQRTDPASLVATGVEALDEALRPSTAAHGGGLPRGHLSELVGPHSSGRMTLALQMMAAATRGGELAALVDTCDRLDVQSAVDAGVELDRLLWIRGEPGGLPTTGAEVFGDTPRALDRAIKAFNLVLQAGGFAIVVLDLADLPSMTMRRLPFTTWMRVQRTIEGSDTACLLLAAEPVGRSAGGLTLMLSGRTSWSGDAPRSRRLSALDVHIRIVSPKRRVQGEVAVRALTTDSR